MVEQQVAVEAQAGVCCGFGVHALEPQQADELAPMFKALGDPVRLRLLSIIAAADGGEICVCDITPQFDLSPSTLSHHLKSLRTSGLVDAERRGTFVYYRVRPAALTALSALLTQG